VIESKKAVVELQAELRLLRESLDALRDFRQSTVYRPLPGA